MAGKSIDFEIDVSGEDILNPDYTVCAAERGGRIKGFKMTSKLIGLISSRYGQGEYRYEKSKRGKSSLKVRLYCIIVYSLFKALRPKRARLYLCRDFDGREEDIKSSLQHFLENLLLVEIDAYLFSKLEKDSNAHKYAYLMRKDTKNRLDTYIKISIEDIERFLK
jgi:hypothetical protein